MLLFRNKIFLTGILILSVAFSFSQKKGRVMSYQAQAEFDRSFFEGNKQKMLGNFSEAAMYFTRCTQLNPQSSASYYELARAFNNQGNYMGALVHAQNAVEIDNSNKWYLLLLASLYEQNNLPNDAIKIYKSLASKYPENPDYHLQLGMMLTKQGKNKEAIKAYNKAESIVGVNEQITLEKERIYLLSGNKQKAIEEIIKLKNAFPYEARYYGILAESYLDNKQPDKALAVFQEILEKDPDNGLAHLSLAEFYQNTGDVDLSFSHLKKAFASHDVETDLKVQMLARFIPYAEKSALVKNQADELIQILLATHPDDVKVHTLNADFLSITGKYYEAREEYRLVVKTEKDKYLIWEQLLLIENELQDFEAMYTESKEAITYFPNLPQFYLFAGMSATKTLRDSEAIQLLEYGLDINAENKNLEIQFYSFLAQAYGNMKNIEKSSQTFEKAIEMMPEDPWLLFEYSKMLLKNDLQLEKAKELIQKAIKFAAEDKPDYFEIYGDILYKLNENEKAIENWQKALNAGGNPETLESKIVKADKQE